MRKRDSGVPEGGIFSIFGPARAVDYALAVSRLAGMSWPALTERGAIDALDLAELRREIWIDRERHLVWRAQEDATTALTDATS